jgi:2,4-dienoyl-CoA reductase-like NADH-dependent reductase (Old Yellow Enzyme family)
MPTISAFEPLTFTRGPMMKNRFMLAPLTNLQSHADGQLSDDEYNWLTMRARGEFGLTMTCAAHVQAIGQGFPGQLGVFGPVHSAGLKRLADGIHAHDSIAIVQLHHAGMRSPQELIGTPPVCPSPNAETQARGLSLAEVEQLREDFIAAAQRAEQAGFDGVELHGAHGYIICQFLSAEINTRDDHYGGTFANRARLLLEIIDGVRARCKPDFSLGVRLSPERFGIKLAEALQLAQQLMNEDKIDYLDMSLWDVFKEPVEEAFHGHSLLSYFAGLERGNVRLGVAGKIKSAGAVQECLSAGADFVFLGRAAILHHDFPRKMQADASFSACDLPVTRDHLRAQGLGQAFVDYMATWRGFVSD